MLDVLKVIFGAIIGFILSLLAEPLKASISERRKTRRIEKDLSLEMTYICSVIATPRHLNPNWRTYLDDTRYSHYFERDREVMFQLKQFNQISSFYDTLHRVKTEQDDERAILMAGNCVLLFYGMTGMP